MQDDKQPGLSWSTPKSSTPAAPEPAPVEPAAAAGPAVSKIEFPSSKKPPSAQAPIYAGLLVVGVILGTMLAAYWLPTNRGATSGTATSTSEAAAAPSAAPTTTKTTPTAAPVVVRDQAAGPSVAIAGLSIARPVWVVVYVSREGSPGNALGARLFFASDKKGTVGLLRNTQKGQSYFVGLSVDDGDRKFSLSKDKPVADADGGPLWATFQAL